MGNLLSSASADSLGSSTTSSSSSSSSSLLTGSIPGISGSSSSLSITSTDNWGLACVTWSAKIKRRRSKTYLGRSNVSLLTCWRLPFNRTSSTGSSLLGPRASRTLCHVTCIIRKIWVDYMITYFALISVVVVELQEMLRVGWKSLLRVAIVLIVNNLDRGLTVGLTLCKNVFNPKSTSTYLGWARNLFLLRACFCFVRTNCTGSSFLQGAHVSKQKEWKYKNNIPLFLPQGPCMPSCLQEEGQHLIGHTQKQCTCEVRWVDWMKTYLLSDSVEGESWEGAHGDFVGSFF